MASVTSKRSGPDGTRKTRLYDAEMKAMSGQSGKRKNPADYTFADMAQGALPGIVKNVKEPMTTCYRFRIDEISRRIGNRKMDSLAASEIEHLQVWLKDEKKLAPKTVNDYISLFVRVFDYAVKEKLFTSNPMKPYEKLDEGDPNKKRKPLSKNEWGTLSSFLRDDWFKDVVTALVETGCRLSEIRMLDWEDIFEEYFQIQADEEFEPKSESGNRLVPKTPNVKKIRERNRMRKSAVPLPGPDESKRFTKTGLQNRWRLVLGQLKKAKGMEIKSRIHDLRHTFGVCVRSDWNSNHRFVTANHRFEEDHGPC